MLNEKKKMSTRKLVHVIFLFISVSLFSLTVNSQQSDPDFVIEKIRKDYFALGIDCDSIKFEKFLLEKRKYGIQDTFRFISEVANYFEDQHLICYQRQKSELPFPSVQAGAREYVIKYLAENKKNKDRNIGLWINDLQTDILGVISVDEKKKIYEGYILHSSDSAKVGKLVLRFKAENKQSNLCEFINTYFQYRQFSLVTHLNKREFQIGSYSRWRRLSNNELTKKSLVSPYSYSASIHIEKKGVVIVKIPDNSGENIQVVDSLVQTYKKEIENSRLLVVDIRNNPGGTIRVYSKLLPYIYTNEIKRPDGYIYVSEDLLQYERKNLKKIDSVKNSEEYSSQIKYIDSLNKLVGKKILYKGKSKIYEAVNPGPIKVALLVNYGCMSAAEAMILDFKQSKKVVVFGEKTAGAIDNLNTFAMRTPSELYSMWMPTFRSIASETHAHYSRIGIEPDVYIKKKDKDWIQFLIHYFEKN